jgi:chromosome partitioning protein
LLVDLDPQGNASTGVGIERRDRRSGTYAALIDDVPVDKLIIETLVPLLDLLPADSDLAGAEVELVALDEREFRLRTALGRPLGRAYEHIVIDCPPSLGLLTLNGLVGAHGVLVPLQCEFFALEGISQLVRTMERVKKGLNPALSLQGIVLTMFDRRNNLSELVAADARSFFGNAVYHTVIPRNVRVSEAPSHGKPVLLYDGRSPGALAYQQLAQEFLQREGAVTA